MSRFSGKCDFYDEIEIFGLEHVLNSKVFIGSQDNPLNLTCREDCIPYYPHIVVASVKSKDVNVIFLSEKSWVDIEEEKYGKSHPLFNYYREQLNEEIEKFKKDLNR